MIGQLLAGRYKVLQILAEGGFGQTYICSDIHLPGKPKCVLKHLKTTSTSSETLESARRLFQKESYNISIMRNILKKRKTILNYEGIIKYLNNLNERKNFLIRQIFLLCDS